jgi:hypothetical protein
MDELSNIDQSPHITPADVDVIKLVDNVVEGATIMGNPDVAFRMAVDLRKTMQMRGIALAKLLSKVRDNWPLFQAGGYEGDFEDAVFVATGIAASTTRKYADTWKALFENASIPEESKMQLMGKPIKSLILLTAAAREGEIKDWKEIVNAPDHSSVREVVRRVRGEQTSSASSLMLVLDRTGSLHVRKGDATDIIGFINLDRAKESELAKTAIDTLCTRANIYRQ